MLGDCNSPSLQRVIQKAVDADVLLQPAVGSPLAQLVASCTVQPLVEVPVAPGALTIAHEDLAEQSDNSLHNGWMDQVAVRASEIVNHRVEAIRNVVIPAVKSIAEAVLADVSKIELEENPYNIVRYSACDVIYIESFMNDVRRNTPSMYFEPEVFFQEDNASTSEILSFLKTGSTTVDQALGVAVGRITDAGMHRMWESLFVDRSKASIDNYGTFLSFVMDKEHGLDYACVIYQLACNAASQQGAGQKYNNLFLIAKQYKEAAAYYINIHANQYVKSLSSGALIRERSNRDGATVVNAVNYTDFLQKGGTAELVIGAANSTQHFTNAQEIIDNAEMLERAYQVQKAANGINYRNEVRRVAVQSMQRHFLESIRPEVLLADEKRLLQENPEELSLILVKFNRLTSLVSAESTKNMYRRVCEIVCNSRFHYMDCYKFLVTVDNLCEEGVEPNEAFTQAVVSEIVTFVVSQIKA